MRTGWFYFLCLILISSLVVGASGDWGKINNATERKVVSNNLTNNESVAKEVNDSGFVSSDFNKESKKGSGTYFTRDFYIAMGLVFIFLLILGVFIWFWIRGSKNRWE